MDNNTKNPTDPNLPPISPTDTGPTPPPPSPSIPPASPPPTPTFDPLASQPLSTPPASQPPTWPPTPSQPEPTPPPVSPLDNPWGAPLQPPPIDSTLSQQPPTPDISTESTPTDLSHLIGNDTNIPLGGTQPTAVAPEPLVTPTTPEVPTLPQEPNHGGGIPKWVIGLGVGLLIVVAGASAYFILGIGQPPKTSSIPATEAPKQEIKQPPPVAKPSPQSATGSASFGELEGSKQATSAAELLRQRQKGR